MGTDCRPHFYCLDQVQLGQSPEGFGVASE